MQSLNAWLWIAPPSPVSDVSAFASLSRPCLPRTDVLGGEVATGVGVEGFTADGWVEVVAAGGGWVFLSSKGKRRYVESPNTARHILDLGVPEKVVLATRNSKARLTIVLRFRRSWRAASPPPSLVASSTATRPSSSLVPSPGTALSQTSSSNDRRRSMGRSDSWEPSVWRIVFGVNCTTPVLSVAVATAKALAIPLKGSSMAPVRLTFAAALRLRT